MWYAVVYCLGLKIGESPIFSTKEEALSYIEPLLRSTPGATLQLCRV